MFTKRIVSNEYTWQSYTFCCLFLYSYIIIDFTAVFIHPSYKSIRLELKVNGNGMILPRIIYNRYNNRRQCPMQEQHLFACQKQLFWVQNSTMHLCLLACSLHFHHFKLEQHFTTSAEFHFGIIETYLVTNCKPFTGLLL